MPTFLPTGKSNADIRNNARPPRALARVQAPALAQLSNQATLRIQRKCDCGGSSDCNCDMANQKKKEPQSPRTPLHRKQSGNGQSTSANVLDSETQTFFEARMQRKEQRPEPPQTSLAHYKIGPVDDPLEHEADQIADRVMRMPIVAATPLQQLRARATSNPLQRKSDRAASTNEAPPIVEEVLRSPGQTLDQPTRNFFEPRLAHDLSHVRLHVDDQAAKSAAAVQARAYTVGRSIVFGANRFSPRTQSGQSLLAHELAHVVQQGRSQSNSVQRDATVTQPQTKNAAQGTITADDCKLAEEVCRDTAAYKALRPSSKFLAESIIAVLSKRPLLERFTTLVKLWTLFETPVKSKATITAETNASTDAAAKQEKTRVANPQTANTDLEEAGSRDPARKFHKVAGPFGGRYEVDNTDPAHIYVRAKVFLYPTGTGTVEKVNEIKGMEDAIEKAASSPGYSVDIIFTTAKDADTFNVGVDPSKWEVADNWSGGEPKGFAHELHHLMAFPLDKYNYIDAHSTNQSMEVADRLIWFKMELQKPNGFNDTTSMMADAEHPNDADACTVAGLNVAACTAIRQQSRQAQGQAQGQAQVQPLAQPATQP